MSTRREDDDDELTRLNIPHGDNEFPSTHSDPIVIAPLISFPYNTQIPPSPLAPQSLSLSPALFETGLSSPQPSFRLPPPVFQPISVPTIGSKQFRESNSPSSPRAGSRAGSRQSSRAPSPAASDASDELPSNVSSEDQLNLLPPECLSGDSERPLRHVDENGDVTHYALRPMWYSVVFILMLELLERFCFYGLSFTQTSYLTGTYDGKWNAGMSAVAASTYVSISVAVAYTTPFLGAILADALLGDFYSLLLGAVVLYLPGLVLIACTTIPGFLGRDFNTRALAAGLLFLWPTGTGILKSIVNIFGAKQYHPLCQSSLIESYYVSFYMCINIGALVGGMVIPLWAQHNVTQAYFLPLGILSAGVILFMSGGSRYVRSKPKGSTGLFQNKKGDSIQDSIPLFTIFRISLLVVPFNIAYSQMATTFIVQGNVMKKAFGWLDAATMNNADAVAVLFFGYVVGAHIYPAFSRRGIKIPTTYKFAFGSALGALAILWALVVDAQIHANYKTSGHKVSILWQVWSYLLIGAGEIFAVSAAYEVAFTASPPEKKVQASALNLFCIGGLPSLICIALYQACSAWFLNSNGEASISHVSEYATAHVGRYFWLLFGICVFGVGLNLLPQVKDFVASTEEKATDLMKSPKTPKVPPRALRDDERSPLLRMKRHQAYLKYGSGPVLYKQGSMRAGPYLAKKARTVRHLKRSMIPKLYQSGKTMNDSVLAGLRAVVSAQGKPILAGDLMMKRPLDEDSLPTLKRASSTSNLY